MRGGKFVENGWSSALKRTTIYQILCGYFSVSKLIIVKGKIFYTYLNIYNEINFFNLQIDLTCEIMTTVYIVSNADVHVLTVT